MKRKPKSQKARKNILSVRFQEWFDTMQKGDPKFTYAEAARVSGLSHFTISKLYREGSHPIYVPCKTRDKIYSLTRDPLLHPSTWSERANLPYDSPEAQKLVKQFPLSKHPLLGNEPESPLEATVQSDTYQAPRTEALQQTREILGALLQGIDAYLKGPQVKTPEEFNKMTSHNPEEYVRMMVHNVYNLAYSLLSLPALSEARRKKLQEALPKKDLGDLIYLLQTIHKTSEELQREFHIYDTRVKLENGPHKVK
ncbi:MAG: hypothetical protein ABIJ21_06510 [Nanoarchaeota archaeon]